MGTLTRSSLALGGVLACATVSAADYTGSVIASGLNNPRGLSFDADGSLYIAEAGIPVGAGPSTLVRGVPNTFTQTGSITRYFNGAQTRVLTGLPSIYASDTLETTGDSGALTRIAPDGTRTTIYSDLEHATGLAIGPDGALYVSNFGSQAGAGEVLRIAPVPEPETYALMLAGLIAVAGIARRRGVRM